MQFVKPCTARKRAFAHESSLCGVGGAASITPGTSMQISKRKRVRPCESTEMKIEEFYDELKH